MCVEWKVPEDDDDGVDPPPLVEDVVGHHSPRPAAAPHTDAENYSCSQTPQ